MVIAKKVIDSEHVTVCTECGDLVHDEVLKCTGCGSVFDGTKAVKLIITEDDVSSIKSFLDIMLENRIVFKDLLRYIKKTARTHGAKSDSVTLEGLVFEC